MNTTEKQAFANEAEKALQHPLVANVIDELLGNLGEDRGGLAHYGILKVSHYAATVARAQALGVNPNSLRVTGEEADAHMLERAARMADLGVPVTVVRQDEEDR